MLARLKKALKEKDQGFTLIELLVVIVIIGILAAIAIPVYLSQREKGVQAGIKSDIKAAATAEETWFIDNAEYVAFPAAAEGAETIDVKVTEDNTIEVVLAGDTYCIAGSSTGTDTDYWYDSESGNTFESGETLAGACVDVPAAA